MNLVMRLWVSNENDLFVTTKHLFDKFQKEHVLVRENSLTKEKLNEIYLSYIPKEPIFRVRPEWDCSTCKHVIRELAVIGGINDSFKLIPFFEYLLEKIELTGDVAFFDKMFSQYIKLWDNNSTIPYSTHNSKFGNKANFAIIDGEEYIFPHFHINVNKKYVNRDISSIINAIQSTEAFAKKYMSNKHILEDILEYIDDGYIYRGEEKRKVVEAALEALEKFEAGVDPRIYAIVTGGTHFNSDVIGTLAEDLLEGIGAELAINRYNEKVSPLNYQQITKKILNRSQIVKLQKDLDKLGYSDITTRFRYATFGDLTINTVLYTNRMIRTSHIEQLLGDAVVEKNRDGKEISLEEFLAMVPQATSIEVGDVGGKVVLIKDTGEKPVYYWNNNIGFCYETGFADHDMLTKKVKEAGGNIDAELRFSLYWDNLDDLDLHLFGKAHIYYGNRKDPGTDFVLDIDMNVRNPIRGAVENIYCKKIGSKDIGETYTIKVTNYTKREDTGNVILNAYYKNKLIKTYKFKNPQQSCNVSVCRVNIFENGINIQDLIPPETSIDEDTIKYKKVHTVLFSPNWWGAEKGNKHIFFLCSDVAIDTSAIRPFNIEQLNKDLKPHRRALSILAEKIKISGNPELVGIGFSFAKERKIPIKINNCKYILNISPNRDYNITTADIERIRRAVA